MAEENAIPTEPTKPDLKPEPKTDPKIVGQRVALAIIIATLIVAVIAIWTHDYRPETDDATLRANFIGVAPQASGHIVELDVKDNQFVKEGDLLFLIDPRPYEDAVASAKASLSLTRKQVSGLQNALKVAEVSIARAEAQRLAAEASVERAEAEYTEADDHVKRLEPLLAKEFATADQLEEARTSRLVADTSVREAQRLLVAAAAAVDEAKVERLKADDDIGQEGDVNARIAAADAQLHEAELNLEYCRVTAPFSGKVVNFNISLGEFARVGVDVFSLVDTRTWYVVANFRETQLKHIEEGSPTEIYLQYKGGKRFKGKVVGLAWAVVPEDGTSAGGLPDVPRNLDWVRLAQRFPVRIQVQNPDDSFRVGASAVVTITGNAPRESGVANP
ncbi:MAG TPA: HlyD family efflux transporter periplasmic adaptor subunit [Candidatus Sulfotelmatobacter sp.]|jgi:multidrug efflux system membrane fusion protein|nr:HlyD family efflux transporter periplasmic adaptor subunit [Candidatus Sulfotelmatobacter sp.]